MKNASDTTADAEVSALRRALELSLRGPRHGVNPQVGCVLLSPTGEVLGEGWHRGAGTPHAEVAALASAAREHGPEAARGATAVVTLEPCDHHGRTGPCSLALIEAGVARVVYGVDDPGRASSGGGERMRGAGLAVVAGVEAAAVEEAIRPWLTAVRHHRPFVTVKWASSLDGRAAAADGSSRWITGPEARADVHRRRSEADAIVVGIGTVLADDPELTARGEGGLLPHQPAPVVLGRRAVPDGARLHAHPLALRRFDGRDLDAVLAALYDDEVRSVFVEGGPAIASAFVAAGLADELVVYLAPTLIGGPFTALGELGIGSIDAQRRLTITGVERLGDDLRIVARPATATPGPSAPTDTSATAPAATKE
ncbi:bifunctional diaminohydroxyphosphoribosylaminopyrimidine deaminase/5-amino-6-(5-phosphoribosylamino)uracil reductase RibD [Herbiconiux sp. VKM Ac-1786]|uniref:bifunctional diaminohydroxyphosphoribosylaminopyrimidine deaminase/5-amino-6-(5-phosphoribosylamino)uracil reductase RibD n=1 Tax=Herbiconiux sp. VKM Ac-1786 TaxID=2783824 RepID=UPI00188DB030|nr:bifunctional diaminohydroxyphosphoribosylaminopyrimidine deaminase/5-amino-6-(5-phosphoribosylamino)uracil reductase RibD [Herbiconiux sp. VKM Ac-1786]MBF4573025.1 bifunctional diaminohydroxyphosphoribosylaminopyrimidine deaminase/5-amino-6-(5-phosphoribosylamino)uracil reductase RibD [Herbiconiux sp. VKM Ac-1786]